jgi:hypothetical protein
LGIICLIIKILALYHKISPISVDSTSRMNASMVPSEPKYESNQTSSLIVIIRQKEEISFRVQHPIIISNTHCLNLLIKKTPLYEGGVFDIINLINRVLLQRYYPLRKAFPAQCRVVWGTRLLTYYKDYLIFSIKCPCLINSLILLNEIFVELDISITFELGFVSM